MFISVFVTCAVTGNIHTSTITADEIANAMPAEVLKQLTLKGVEAVEF